MLSNDIDLLHPPAELEKKKHKLKRLVQSPNSFFMVRGFTLLCFGLSVCVFAALGGFDNEDCVLIVGREVPGVLQHVSPTIFTKLQVGIMSEGSLVSQPVN